MTVERRLDVKNTLIKMLLDQTIGAAVNNAGFLIGITLVRGGSWSDAMAAVSSVSLLPEATSRGSSAQFRTCLPSKNLASSQGF